MDSLSSLELFLLAAVKEGCATAYDLHAQAGLSVGSTQPALQRKVKKGWLRVKSTGSRGRRQHQLTATGQQELTTWRRHVDEAIKTPPSDPKSLFRLLTIAWKFRDQQRMKKLLWTAERASTEQKEAAFSPALSGFYNWLLSIKAVEERRSRVRLYKNVSALIKNR